MVFQSTLVFIVYSRKGPHFLQKTPQQKFLATGLPWPVVTGCGHATLAATVGCSSSKTIVLLKVAIGLKYTATKPSLADY